VSEADRGALRAVHADLLERWRKVMNLVGPGPIAVHFRDVDQATAGMKLTGAWADLGSGAGFPGLVLAAAHPDATFDLVESRQKRAAFLDEVTRRADVRGVRVLAQRVEDLPAGRYDGVTGRAFAPPPDLIAHARRLLKPGGRLLLFLQADGDVTVPPDFAAEGGNTYAADGHRRRSLVLRFTPTEAPHDPPQLG
jgi:16S rRNA (guanine527-N7)-methyltransferase